MGGSIQMHGAPQGGSVFTLELAAAEEEHDGPKNVAPKAIDHTTLKVLVVDDDAVNILVAQGLLDQLGHQATVRQDGASALALLNHELFDVILLDIAMPDEDGVSIAKKIRASGGDYGGIPILAMTAKVMTESVESYKAAGMNGVVPKPIIVEQLECALAKVSAARLPDKLARMRSDIGAERCRLILQESSRAIGEAQRQAERYYGGESGKSLAAVLHRLGPTAELLGFSYLSSEALALETQLNETDDRVDLECLSRLLTQSNDRISLWIGKEAASSDTHARALVSRGRRSSHVR